MKLQLSSLHTHFFQQSLLLSNLCSDIYEVFQNSLVMCLTENLCTEYDWRNIDGLVQDRCNSIANTLELSFLHFSINMGSM